jgi:hypothetical protein
MIVRISYDLMCTLLSVGSLPGSVSVAEKDLSHLYPYTPAWMRDFAFEGSEIMVISREEYDGLDYEVAGHVQVLKF